jgi:hypothetical protein
MEQPSLQDLSLRLSELQDRVDEIYRVLMMFRQGNEALLTQVDLALRSAVQAVQSDVARTQTVSTEIQDRLEADTTKTEVLDRIAALEANQATMLTGLESVLVDTSTIKTDIRQRIPTPTPEPEAGSERP